jgi:hypothetical protein
MNIYIIIVIILLIIIAIVIALQYCPKQYINKKEHYKKFVHSSSETETDCTGMFPYPPTTTPPTAYGQLVAPMILSSSDNKDIPNTMLDDVYSDKYTCHTPWSLRCSTNDSCAQYGIGESCEGPEGSKFCVCESKYKNSDKQILADTVTDDNIVIGVGGVCSKNEQCCTNTCSNMPGIFSKTCICPQGKRWDIDSGLCVEQFYSSDTGQFSKVIDYSSYYNNPVHGPVPTFQPIPKGSIESVGKLCISTSECSLGEACTPDNFCASQLIPDIERDGNKFFAGAKCENSDQCTNNLQCSDNVCSCADPLIFDYTSRTCQCSDGTKVLNNGECKDPNQVKRHMCPTTPPAFSLSITECGLGERFNPSTKQCMCVANLHSQKINQGGLCENDQQCYFGKCSKIGDVNVCVSPNTDMMAVAKYS